MNIITQEAHRRQGVVKLALRKGKSFAARIYGVNCALKQINIYQKKKKGCGKHLLILQKTDASVIITIKYQSKASD